MIIVSSYKECKKKFFKEEKRKKEINDCTRDKKYKKVKKYK